MSSKENNGNVSDSLDAYDLFGLMSTLLSQPDKPDLTKKNLWVVALDKGESILNVELCGMGNYHTVVYEPADILSIPLQKKAFGIVLIHNCPTGELTPSQEDIDVTDRLHQAAAIVGIKLLDHLIITESSCYDFKNNGLMDQIYKSGKYLPSHQRNQNPVRRTYTQEFYIDYYFFYVQRNSPEMLFGKVYFLITRYDMVHHLMSLIRVMNSNLILIS